MFSEKWDYKKFIKYVLPSVLSMLFISLFTIVDGIFISRYVGSTALAAVNMVFPIYNLAFAFTIMLAVGGSALISISLGKGDGDQGSNDFSFISLVMVITSLVMSIGLYLGADGIFAMLGLTGQTLVYGDIYGKILIYAIPLLSLKVSYEYFLRVDDCANLSLLITVLGGVINIVLDYIFVAKLQWGVAGAGWATLIGIGVPTVIGIYHFVFKAKMISYVKPKANWKFLYDTCINGSSEMVTELSGGIVAVLFNLVILSIAGSKGVAALSAIFYLFFVFKAVAIGVTMGIQPAISYNYGANNYMMIRDIFKKAMVVTGLFTLVLSGIAFANSSFFVNLFIKNDPQTAILANDGLKIFVFGIVISAVNMLASGYFTAINNGKISAIISFTRSIILVIPGIYILSGFFGITGVWLTVPMAEVGTLILTLYYFSKDQVIMNKGEKILGSNKKAELA